jgi:hypothetical protein
VRDRDERTRTPSKALPARSRSRCDLAATLEADRELVGVADVHQHGLGQNVTADEALDVLSGERRFDDDCFADDVVQALSRTAYCAHSTPVDEGVLMATTPTGCSPRRAATPAWMTVPDAPVSIIAAIETGLGTGCPLETRIASTA